MVTQFDIDCCIDDALRKGREEERKKQEEERRNLIKKNLQKGKTPEDLADTFDIPLSQVLEIQQELKAQLAALQK